MQKAVAADPNGTFTVHPGVGHGYMMAHGRHYHAAAADASFEAAMKLIAPLRSARAAE